MFLLLEQPEDHNILGSAYDMNMEPMEPLNSENLSLDYTPSFEDITKITEDNVTNMEDEQVLFLHSFTSTNELVASKNPYAPEGLDNVLQTEALENVFVPAAASHDSVQSNSDLPDFGGIGNQLSVCGVGSFDEYGGERSSDCVPVDATDNDHNLDRSFGADVQSTMDTLDGNLRGEDSLNPTVHGSTKVVDAEDMEVGDVDGGEGSQMGVEETGTAVAEQDTPLEPVERDGPGKSDKNVVLLSVTTSEAEGSSLTSLSKSDDVPSNVGDVDRASLVETLCSNPMAVDSVPAQPIDMEVGTDHLSVEPVPADPTSVDPQTVEQPASEASGVEQSINEDGTKSSENDPHVSSGTLENGIGNDSEKTTTTDTEHAEKPGDDDGDKTDVEDHDGDKENINGNGDHDDDFQDDDDDDDEEEQIEITEAADDDEDGSKTTDAVTEDDTVGAGDSAGVSGETEGGPVPQAMEGVAAVAEEGDGEPGTKVVSEKNATESADRKPIKDGLNSTRVALGSVSEGGDTQAEEAESEVKCLIKNCMLVNCYCKKEEIRILYIVQILFLVLTPQSTYYSNYSFVYLLEKFCLRANLYDCSYGCIFVRVGFD